MATSALVYLFRYQSRKSLQMRAFLGNSAARDPFAPGIALKTALGPATSLSRLAPTNRYNEESCCAVVYASSSPPSSSSDLPQVSPFSHRIQLTAAANTRRRRRPRVST